MSGIYLHIPFCKQACTYCNFHFSTSLRYKDEMIEAILSEIEQEKYYLGGETVKSIYFGGGTPSLLSTDEISKLLKEIYKNFDVAKDVEITLEANPDDIDKEKLKGWKENQINRLSIGVQSFFEEELRWMNRAHNAEQAVSSLQLAVGQFDNITIDLIYGSPLLTDDMWKQNVEKAIAFGIPHFSCYALTVEEKTPLHKLIGTDIRNEVENEKQARQFLLLMQWLKEKGYEHYEVSNFAKKGYRSRHNSSYWKGEKYLGLGPSAHSFNGTERRWNVSNNQMYLQGIKLAEPKRETELLTSIQKLNEYIMISLRTIEGLDMKKIETSWGFEERKRIENNLKKYINANLVNVKDPMVRLTDEGMLRADGIASDLFA
ncbi:MAG: radical SAM family heme chaperone HemW [Flavisolibacter sp.]